MSASSIIMSVSKSEDSRDISYLSAQPETEIGGFFSLIRHDMIMLGFRKDEVVTHGILMRTQLSGSHDKIR